MIHDDREVAGESGKDGNRPVKLCNNIKSNNVVTDQTREQSDVSDLAIALAEQLLNHHGCSNERHNVLQNEHDAAHESHTGLGEYADQVADFPNVLSSPVIARKEDKLIEKNTSEKRRLVYCGLSQERVEPPHICLEREDEDIMTEATFDIDSVLGFANSLAVAKQGIRWNTAQMPVSDLKGSLHLDYLPVQYVDQGGRSHHVRRPVHQIPHYTFGRLIGFEDISLYILFPRLYREEQKSSRLRDEDFATWMDRVALPAIYQQYDRSLLQHFPTNTQHSVLNSTARGVEGRAQRTWAHSRQQMLFYFLQAGALDQVWKAMLESVQAPGLSHFQDLVILIQGKNLKTLTKGDTWRDMTRRFNRHWQSAVDESQLSEKFFVDVGKESCPTGESRIGRPGLACFGDLQEHYVGPRTALWRRCCLESYVEWMKRWTPTHNEAQHTTPKEDFYPMAMMKDSGSMILETRSRSTQRQAGLLYSQFSSSVKEVFAAGDVYPFTNSGMETLAIDPQLRKT